MLGNIALIMAGVLKKVIYLCMRHEYMRLIKISFVIIHTNIIIVDSSTDSSTLRFPAADRSYSINKIILFAVYKFKRISRLQESSSRVNSAVQQNFEDARKVSKGLHVSEGNGKDCQK